MTIAVIRPFRPSDLAAWDSLNRAWLVSHNLLEEPDELHLRNPEGEILAKGGVIHVAELNGVVVGTCGLEPVGDGVYELVKVAVAPSAQGRGLGRQLIESCLAEARRLGAAKVVLLSNSQLTSALNLYRSLGFVNRPVPPGAHYVTADVYMETPPGWAG
jgi:ribosomal protein S18 acetylase RimI-like enzyme